ncbi:hypothetical protein PVAND_013769 [Polypedilum vanderplanki]|uniref:Uncharacterized protein n=1 Tax=Polypedilum vanderplanki TaxID=319348 RepID=A0A9J6CRR1_POLVA|nr:hypothetical protein PVAND_013769 [Polypedilum vanderplanki]
MKFEIRRTKNAANCTCQIDVEDTPADDEIQLATNNEEITPTPNEENSNFSVTQTEGHNLSEKYSDSDILNDNEVQNQNCLDALKI